MLKTEFKSNSFMATCDQILQLFSLCRKPHMIVLIDSFSEKINS